MIFLIKRLHNATDDLLAIKFDDLKIYEAEPEELSAIKLFETE